MTVFEMEKAIKDKVRRDDEYEYIGSVYPAAPDSIRFWTLITENIAISDNNEIYHITYKKPDSDDLWGLSCSFAVEFNEDISFSELEEKMNKFKTDNTTIPVSDGKELNDAEITELYNKLFN